MIDERTQAVRMVRREADRLRLACIAAAGGAALLHIAFDQDFDTNVPVDQAVLLGRLGSVGK